MRTILINICVLLISTKIIISLFDSHKTKEINLLTNDASFLEDENKHVISFHINQQIDSEICEGKIIDFISRKCFCITRHDIYNLLLNFKINQESNKNNEPIEKQFTLKAQKEFYFLIYKNNIHLISDSFDYYFWKNKAEKLIPSKYVLDVKNSKNAYNKFNLDSLKTYFYTKLAPISLKENTYQIILESINTRAATKKRKNINYSSFLEESCIVTLESEGIFDKVEIKYPYPIHTDNGKIQNSSDLFEFRRLSTNTNCEIGDFLALDYNSDCITCPNGFQCVQEDTIWPSICLEGYYANNATSCLPCPEGTYNFEKGSTDSSNCIPCPEGKNCTALGANKPDLIAQCHHGYVCGSGTDMNAAILCPNGFYCSYNTTPGTQYNNPCQLGYICGEGTTTVNRNTPTCTSNYYCPLGSKFYQNETDRLTKCPYGTITISAASSNIFECVPDSNYNFLINFSNRRVLSQVYEKNTKMLRNLLPNDTNYNGYVSIDMNTQNNYYNNINKVDLVGILTDQLLNTLYILSNYNTNRIPLFSISPMLKNVGYQPIKTTISLSKYDNNSFETCYYLIEQNSYALITFDLRHLSMPTNTFLYGIDWDISITKFSSNNDTLPTIISMPEIFLNETNLKSKVHEFNLYSQEEIIIQITVNIYNGIFSTYSYLFLNTATVQVAKPSRAILDTSNFFAVILKRARMVEYPINLPFLNYTIKTSTKSIENRLLLNYISYASTDLTIKNRKMEGLNSFTQTSLFWGDSSMLGMPYLPFFSNCKGYGKFIPLWGLVELNPNCILVPEENIQFSTQFSFGKTIVADNCQIEIDCIYDEDIDVSEPYWYNSSQGTYLFSLTKQSIMMNQMYDAFSGNDLIDAYVNSNLPTNTIPGTVQLNINYFQKSTIEKRLVSVGIQFLDPIPIQNIQNNYTVPYKLNVSFIPYSHTKLMVRFSFDSSFYILLYAIQGVIEMVIILVFFFYHKLMSRMSPLPKFHFFSFIPLTFPSALYGFLLAFIPISFVLFILTLTMSGKLFSPCSQTSITNGTCFLSIFDYMPSESLKVIDVNSLRMSRVGTALIAIGLYLLYKSSKLMISDEPVYYKVSFDKNYWNILSWKMFNFLYINFFLLSVCTYFMLLSFSNLWSNNFWPFLYMFKILGIVLEIYLKTTLSDQLLICGIPCVINIMQGLLNFGANDYVQFMIQNFVEIISLTVERLYLEPFIIYMQENWKDIYKSLEDYFRKILKLDLEIEDEQEQEELARAYKEPILLEYGAVNMSEKDVLKTKKNNLQNDNQLTSSKTQRKVENLNSNLVLDDFRLDSSNNSFLSNNIESNRSEDESARLNFLNLRLQNNKKAKKTIEIKVEKLYDKYKSFTADMLSLFFNIPFYFFIWIYYNETQILYNYSITQGNFVYFYFFVIISPFFYVSIDIMFHNILGYFFGTKMHEFLDYIKYRFRIRKTIWALDEKKINSKISPEFRKLDKLCFSSQYYFILTIYISGVCFGVVGITTSMVNASNIFQDIATALIFAYIWLLCVLVERASIYIGKKLKIWQFGVEVDEFKRKENRVSKTQKCEFTSETKVLGRIVKPAKIFPIKNWEIVGYKQEQEEIIVENIKTERMVQDHIRRQFLYENKSWLKEILGTILSPRTLYLNKDRVIDAMKSRIKLNNINEESHEVKIKEEDEQPNKNQFFSKISEQLEEITNDNCSFDTELIKFKKKPDDTFKLLEGPFGTQNKLKKISFGYREGNKLGKILKTWLVKSRTSVELFNLVKLAVHHKRKGQCDNCGSRIYLRATCGSPILQIFERFLQETKSNYDNYDAVLFKIYFLEHGNIITLCSNCEN